MLWIASRCRDVKQQNDSPAAQVESTQHPHAVEISQPQVPPAGVRLELKPIDAQRPGEMHKSWLLPLVWCHLAVLDSQYFTQGVDVSFLRIAPNVRSSTLSQIPYPAP